MLKDIIAPIKAKNIKTTILANENIVAYKVATTTGYNADSANSGHNGRIAGVTVTAINSGFAGQVVSEGEIQNDVWTWTIGNVIYLNGTNLSITPPISGFRVIIGEAVDTNKIYVNISECINF